MSTCIEIAARCIRLVTVTDGTITEMKSVAYDAGTDPAQLIAGMLPPKAGPVRVLVANEDVLVRLIIQPPCPRERLDRVIGFEMTGGGDSDAPLADWLVVPGFGSGDYRVLGLAVKRGLVQRLRQAMQLGGSRLEAVTHPAVGLYHAWRASGGLGDALLADVGGASTHIAVVRQDELALVRTLAVGMDLLVDQIAEVRSLPQPEAARLATQLRSSSPEELQHLVKRQAGQVAVAMSGVIKFAKAQLQIDDWQPAAIALAGAGAQVHGFADAVAERSGLACKPFNPFASLKSTLPAERMDACAALPSPWSAAIGAAAAKPVLDAMGDERRAAARFWATDGILRVGVALTAVLLIAALALNERVIWQAQGDDERLGAEQTGLVPIAERKLSAVDALEKGRVRDAGRITWLGGEHRASRISAELLAAVASIQHPENCPVALTAYRVKRGNAGLVVELEGYAQSVGRLRTSDVLQTFEKQLREAYAPIASLEERPQPIDRDRQRFHLVVGIPDATP